MKPIVIFCLENGEHPEQLSKNYKKHLKSVIKENIPNIVFAKSAQKNKPKQLVSNVTQVEAVNIYTETAADDMKSLLKLAKK